MSDHSEQSGHIGHVVPVRTYVLVFLALMAGTALTTAAAYTDLGRWNTVVALAIAVTKMMLVVLFFMHAYYSTKRTQLIIIAGVFWLATMLFLTLGDYASRSWDVH